MKYLGLFLLAALSVISCREEDDVDLEIPTSSTHELQEVVRIVDEPWGVFFNNTVEQIEFLSNGNFIIRGGRNLKNVLEISQDGELVSTIGQEGKGPGEFVSVDRILVTPGDSLYIYDKSHARHQLFVNIDGDWQLNRALPLELESDQAFNIDYPLKIFNASGDNDGYRALMTNFISSSDTTNSFYYYVTDVDKDLVQVGDIELLKFVQDAAVFRASWGVATDWDNRFQRAFYLFNSQGSEPVYISNWSNEIWTVDENGNKQLAGSLPFEHFPTDESVNEYIKRISEIYETERVQLIESKFLDYEPYYRNIYLDNDKLWVHFARENETDPEWAISTISGEIEAMFRNPDNFEPLTVHDGKLYGLQHVNDVPNLVSFKLED